MPRRNRATADAARIFYGLAQVTQGQFFSFSFSCSGSRLLLLPVAGSFSFSFSCSGSRLLLLPVAGSRHGPRHVRSVSAGRREPGRRHAPATIRAPPQPPYCWRSADLLRVRGNHPGSVLPSRTHATVRSGGRLAELRQTHPLFGERCDQHRHLYAISGYCPHMDEQFRESQRRARESGSQRDEIVHLQNRLRAGELTRDCLALAAYCGNRAAQELNPTNGSIQTAADAKTLVSLIWRAGGKSLLIKALTIAVQIEVDLAERSSGTVLVAARSVLDCVHATEGDNHVALMAASEVAFLEASILPRGTPVSIASGGATMLAEVAFAKTEVSARESAALALAPCLKPERLSQLAPRIETLALGN